MEVVNIIKTALWEAIFAQNAKKKKIYVKNVTMDFFLTNMVDAHILIIAKFLIEENV